MLVSKQLYRMQYMIPSTQTEKTSTKCWFRDNYIVSMLLSTSILSLASCVGHSGNTIPVITRHPVYFSLKRSRPLLRTAMHLLTNG